ncbi:hypothetical protein NHP190003_14650 [Helicobacter sp. NHP19-003]|uniref:Uncharacterized protein n=1 Tax=Helicobacter gastrocanis TaxID=2849641 RepID=A0ABM7SDX2_9HELI|nr:hypothetical protein [Helicobacter sp. NHP19-003]BCZ18183.1 hypothetical protein NHP190003_14650 [Helicobacter sp. NHP19-003]
MSALVQLIYKLSNFSELEKEKSKKFSVDGHVCFLNLQEVEGKIIVEVYQSGG